MSVINFPPNQLLKRSFVVFAFIGLLTSVLCACSPQLDWRTVTSTQAQYSALFPAKPEHLERHLVYQDQDILQVLDAVKIDDAIFSISTIELKKDQASLEDGILESSKNALSQQTDLVKDASVIREANYQTADRQRFAVKDYYFEVKMPNHSQFMRSRWIVRRTPAGEVFIYQVSVLLQNVKSGTLEQILAQEQYATFFEEFHPL